jgi:hypothetical protein
MTNEKHDPWALLREARESVYQHKERLLDCDHDHETCTCDLAAKKIVLLSSIDAALAERQDSATNVVESEPMNWMQNGFVVEEQIANVSGGTVVVRDRGGTWAWALQRRGYCATEAEAKSAAIAAAKGMK